MKKEFTNVEAIGWILFILLMIPLLLLFMSEPSMANDEPQMHLPSWIAWSWLITTLFSVLLIVIGKYIK